MAVMETVGDALESLAKLRDRENSRSSNTPMRSNDVFTLVSGLLDVVRDQEKRIVALEEKLTGDEK